MTALDTYTLAITTSLVGVFLAASMLGLWAAGERHRAVLWWAAAGLLLAAGYQFARFALMPGDPPLDARWAIAMANLGIVGSHGLLLLGFQRYLGRALWWKRLTVAALFLLIAGTQWSAMYGNVVFRVGMLLLFETWILGSAAWLLWYRSPPTLVRHCRILAMGVLAILGVLTARWLVLFSMGHGYFPGGATALLTPLFFSSMAFYLFLAMMLVQLLFRAKQVQFQDMAQRDPLTGLHNRRNLRRDLLWLLERAHREGEAFSVIMLDIDHFKRVNDEYGHEAGDLALIHSADLLRDVVRDTDLLFRLGGEEFLVLAPDTAKAGGHALASKILKAFRSRPMAYNAASISLTVSLGVTCVDAGQAAAADDVLRAADQAVYDAKRQGRNRIA